MLPLGAWDLLMARFNLIQKLWEHQNSLLWRSRLKIITWGYIYIFPFLERLDRIVLNCENSLLCPIFPLKFKNIIANIEEGSFVLFLNISNSQLLLLLIWCHVSHKCMLTLLSVAVWLTYFFVSFLMCIMARAMRTKWFAF